MQLEGGEEGEEKVEIHGLHCIAIGVERIQGLPGCSGSPAVCPCALSWPGLYRPPGAGTGWTAWPQGWAMAVSGESHSPASSPNSTLGSHPVPAIPSCYITGDNWWAWVSMARQGQRRPAREPMHLCVGGPIE